MAKNCFEGVPHEALDFCPNADNAAGISTRIFYVPAEHIDKMDLPKDKSSYAGSITISEASFALKAEKSWKGIDILVDENEMKNSLVGNKGNLKAKTELEVFIPSLRAETVGWVDTYKNVPMVFAVPDSNGTFWLVGSKVNPAFFESADGTTGKKYEDNSGISGKISANSRLHKYDGAIAES